MCLPLSHLDARLSDGSSGVCEIIDACLGVMNTMTRDARHDRRGQNLTEDEQARNRDEDRRLLVDEVIHKDGQSLIGGSVSQEQGDE